jgi:predicted AlkP superfamily pyrophosphatase or phosphodiesterase
VDGLNPDFYRRPDAHGLKIPNLRELAAAGASADAVESIYPSTTYPAHATIVTGVRPREHGIYAHLASRNPSEQARPWHWYAAAIRVPTLWDAACRELCTSAGVSWPVSAGARIDWNIPEIWSPLLADPYSDFETVARNSTRGLFAEVFKLLAPMLEAGFTLRNKLSPEEAKRDAGALRDRLRTEAAIYLWRHRHPDLLLVHYVNYDATAHHFGPAAPESLAAVERTDEEIGRVRECLGSDAVLVVLSDHGFVAVEHDCAPHVALLEAGLFDRDSTGSLRLKRLGTIHAGGSFAIYWLEPPTAAEQQSLDRAVERIEGSGSVAHVVDQATLACLGADPDAALILDAAPGYVFSDRAAGALIQPSRDRGTHGHMPSCPGLEAGLIVAGPGITPGKNLGRVSLTRIAPALARLLGLRPESAGLSSGEFQALQLE